MKKLLTVFFVLLSVCFLLALNPINTNATTYTITVQSNSFSPSSQNVLVGDTIHFQWLNGNHTTTCDPGTLAGTSYPAGFFGWDSPMNSGTTDYYVAITQPGTYVYGCQPHWPAMQGTITAGTGYKYWYGINGGGDGISWSDPLNWLDGTLPSAADSVKLDNSFVTSTYVVNLPVGAVTTIIKRITIEPASPNFIYLNLTSATTNNPGFTVGDGVSGTYDFVLKKNSVFTNSSGASGGTGITLAGGTLDSIQLLDSALWIHNCTRGTSGVVQQLTKATNCNRGIWRYDVPTLSSFSITASGINYGSLQIYGLAAGGGLLSKRYTRAGGTAITIRGDYYIEEHAIDSSAMTTNLNIWGNYTCYGKMIFSNTASQRLNFSGTSLQTITCDGLTSASFTISTGMIFNNAAGFYITSPFYGDTITMTNGNINTAPGAWLGIGYDASNVGSLTRTGGIVTGQLERWYVAGSTSDSLIFPVGTSTVLKQARVRFSTAPTTAGRIGIKYIDNGNESSDLPAAINDGGFSVTKRSNSYWLMTGTFLTGGLIDVAFDGNGQLGITDPQNLRVVWSNDGTSFSMQGVHKDGNNSIGRRTDIGFYFSNFYLGGNGTTNPLPVELSSFAATTIKNEVILDWATGHEINNRLFEVQRAPVSAGIIGDFTSIGTVSSKGNSNSVQSYKFSDKNLNIGHYSYRLKQVDYNGNFQYFPLNTEVIIGLPAEFSISQNYPNPFNPSTSINYEIPYDGIVKLAVYDNLGREVKTLVNGNVSSGYYKVDFNAAGLPSGAYFCRIDALSGSQKFEKVFKMLLVK